MQTERWEASNASSPTGQISSSTTISPSYYKQFSISIAFSVLNGGLPPVGPTFTSESFGVTDSSTLTGTPTSYWTDAGSNYNASSVLTATQERWITDSSTTGTVTSPLSLNFVYDHQYYLAMQSSQSGGTISPASEWINAGNTISISNSASQGWKFEFWTGSGTGSYSGSSGSTTIEVQAPIKENATFYVGLTIGTTSGGSILYSYGNSGSSHVTTQAQVYVPDGSVVTLNGNPSSFLYKLDSWSGVATGTSSQTTITINSPSTVQAQFGYNIVSIGGIIAVIVVAIFGIVAVMMRRKPG